jgi:hypothetical protein
LSNGRWPAGGGNNVGISDSIVRLGKTLCLYDAQQPMHRLSSTLPGANVVKCRNFFRRLVKQLKIILSLRLMAYHFHYWNGSSGPPGATFGDFPLRRAQLRRCRGRCNLGRCCDGGSYNRMFSVWKYSCLPAGRILPGAAHQSKNCNVVGRFSNGDNLNRGTTFC